MSLEAEIEKQLAKTILGNGRAGKEVETSYVRDIDEKDYPKLLEMPGKESTIQTMRQSHHQVAKLLARGARVAEVSAITGYTTARIGQLQRAPAFRELLAYYSEQVDAASAEVVERMKILSLDAMEELQDRLDTRPEAFKIEDLIKLSTSMLDRTGHGPTQKVEAQVAVFDAETLAKIKSHITPKGVVVDAQSYRPIKDGRVLPSPSPGVGASEIQDAGLAEEGPQVRGALGQGPDENGAGDACGAVDSVHGSNGARARAA